MSYFLKKTNNKKGTYLQIYESYYDPTRKCGAHRSYKPLGYVHELQATGIEDPIAVFTKEVQKLNQKCKQKKQAEKEQHISDVSPEISMTLSAVSGLLISCRRQLISDLTFLI